MAVRRPDRTHSFVTGAACRNIDKAGGLDTYILGTSDSKLDSDVGVGLKQQLLAQLKQGGGAPSFAAGGVEQQQQQQQQPGES